MINLKEFMPEAHYPINSQIKPVTFKIIDLNLKELLPDVHQKILKGTDIFELIHQKEFLPEVHEQIYS